jgi:peptidyl-prolyl cis-trans isomerase D
MVQKFRGVVLGLIVFALAAVFVLQFGGPQAQGCSEGAQGAAAEVYGRSISRTELSSARVIVTGGSEYPPEIAEQYKLDQNVLYGLIERELLAREARKLGYAVSEDAVLQRVADDGVLYASVSIDGGPYLPPSGPRRFSFKDSKGEFDKDNLRGMIQYTLRRSVREFSRSQAEETIAQRMRELIIANVAVGPGEVWDSYVREKESVTLQYVRFAKSYYAQQLEPTAADLSAYIAAHGQEVDAEYAKQKHRYTGLEKQVRARHILIKVASDAEAALKQAARTKIDALLARARAGEDFAALARANSEDEGSAKKGGDLGFNPKGRMVKPFDEAQFALQPGQISDVVESTFGLHIIKVEAVREGDVPLDEAKRELADKLYRDSKAAEMAKRDAHEIMRKVQAGATLEVATAQLNGLPPPVEGETAATPSDPLAPQVQETRGFGRTDTPIAGPFDSTPLVKAAYALTEQAPLGNAPMQLGDDWFVYRLQTRTLADQAGFTDAERERLENALRRRRQQDTLTAYIRNLRDKALADGEIFVEESLLPKAAAPPAADDAKKKS